MSLQKLCEIFQFWFQFIRPKYKIDVDRLDMNLVIQDSRELLKALESLKLSREEQNQFSYFYKEIQKLQAREDIQILCPSDLKYPSVFQSILKHPPVLILKGSWPAQFFLGVVGSRRIKPETSRWMEQELQVLLRDFKITIVSGGAGGVDQKAHLVSLIEGNPTLCFLPSGISEPYPARIQSWFDGIVESGGGIVSPFPPWFRMYKSFFEYRNRLIAAASDYLFVPQAARRSGSLMTVRLALELGKPIGTLPQSPLNREGLGCNDLIKDGADLIRDSRDLEWAMKEVCEQSKWQKHQTES